MICRAKSRVVEVFVKQSRSRENS